MFDRILLRSHPHFVFLLSIVAFFRLLACANAMWPQPAHYHQGGKVLWLAKAVRADIEHVPEDFATHWGDAQKVLTTHHEGRAQLGVPKELQYINAAFDRIKQSIFEDRFVPDKFYAIDHDFDPSTADPVFIEAVHISLHSSVAETAKRSPNEAYTLEVTEEGAVYVHASSYQGALHALQTFRQLFYAHSNPQMGGIYLSNAPIEIKDSPRFEHRGLNLDIARNRIYPDDALRTLDAMAAQKLNQLHIHATDSQSWPLDIPSIPELARKGAYHRSQIWTSEHLSHVQAYGMERGIDVYIEIDMPGHTGSIFHSHPNLTVAYGRKWTTYALEPPAGQLKLAEPGVQQFLARLFEDLLPRLTSNKFHIGCDELNLESYTLEPGLESADRDILKPYLQKFFDHVFEHLERHGRTAVAWEEALVDWDLKLPSSAIVQSWRSQQSLAQITGKGHRALFGPSSHWYLDCGLGGWADPEPGNPDSKVKPPFPDWCPPYKNWRLVYTYDPLEDVPAEHHHLIIGGEAHIWGELTDSVTLDGMLWPRLAAAAEVLWCGKQKVDEDATRRLAEMRERLVSRRVAAGMVQMEWSLKNPGGSYM